MMKRVMISVLMVVAVFAGCAKPKEKPVAVVNGKAISKAEFENRVKEQMTRHSGQTEEMDEAKLRGAILNQLINEKLMLEGAAEKGVEVADMEVGEQVARIKNNYADEAAYQAQLKERGMTEQDFQNRIREQLLISKFKASLVDAEAITEDEMKAFYKDAPVPLMTPARVKMRMIQVGNEEEINAIAADIKKNGFDKVAANLEEEGKVVISKSDWVQPDTFSKATADAINEAKVGDLVGPLQGMGGWYIIKVDDMEDPRVESYEEAKDKIKSLVIMQKRQGQEHMWIEKKKGTASITKNL